jgi:hypothetical protein|tara:strand:+ start:1440 stop:1607 length:168 start_codon:yes stop_codon:yes gene_type:complete
MGVIELIVMLIVLGSLMGLIIIGWGIQAQKHAEKIKHKRWMKEHIRQLKQTNKEL